MKGMVLLFSLLLIVRATSAQRLCGHSEYTQLLSSPALQNNAKPGNGYFRQLSSTAAKVEDSVFVPAVITIPVVIHILYNTADQNISDEQVLSQITALNKDYRALNPDHLNAPTYFAGRVADCGFEFRLATSDPSGRPTSGIIRKHTSIQMFGVDDRAKFSSIGGDDAWEASRYLNIWVCNLAGGILGYSSYPGGAAEKDGVVISSFVFGTTGKVTAPFHLGRTATHEIGHWLNLRHIWGDSYCGDDQVDDTPKQRSSSRGCPSGQVFSCETNGTGDMYMNFMDLTDDACMYMFTQGQKQRMRALFEAGGQRRSLLSSAAFNTASAPPPTSETAPETNASVSVSVSPNPTSGNIVITVNTADKQLTSRQVNIYNQFGQPVLKQQMTGNELHLNVTHLAKGIYFIELTGTAKKMSTRFIKL